MRKERRQRHLVKYSDGVLTKAKQSALSSVAVVKEGAIALVGPAEDYGIAILKTPLRTELPTRQPTAEEYTFQNDDSQKNLLPMSQQQ